MIAEVVQGLNLARSGLYFLEALPLTFASRWIANPDLPPPTNEQIAGLWRKIVQLHEAEAEHLRRGDYPLAALEIENPLHHMRSYMEVLRDGLKVAMRMRQRKSKSFSASAQALHKDLPEYYTRNFHYQTDGYLSEASARRYDHQVEILFSGTAGAMRRLILPVLKANSRGEGQWLELGAGSGSTTRGVLETFRDAKVTALDMSAPYLKVAQENLRRYTQVDFVQSDATDLKFKNDVFDVVYSVFVLHELPQSERDALMREAYRVLKPGGLLVLADSLQFGDQPELDWALERFPIAYHEPFFRNYAQNDVARMLEKATGRQAETTCGFLTKVVWLHKPSSSALS